jgi:2-hydroxy-3-oxopropionate reductase
VSEINVGFIGLGIMGKPMAHNLLKAGFRVTVYNRTRQRSVELQRLGARAADSPRAVAAESEIVITIVSDSPDVRAVILGAEGVIGGIRAGSIVIDMSTISPQLTREIAEKLKAIGVEMLDAPVSGGEKGAIEGTLSIMVGGDATALERARPVLLAMGKTITHVGDAGAGQVAKAANQIMVAAQMVAMGELLIFSQKAGVDPQKVVEAIKGGAAQCWTLDVKPARLFVGNRTPGFKASMQAKDLNIILETAREYGVPLPSAAVDAQLYNAMLQNGMGNLDNSAVIGMIEELAGVTLNISYAATDSESS